MITPVRFLCLVVLFIASAVITIKTIKTMDVSTAPTPATPINTTQTVTSTIKSILTPSPSKVTEWENGYKTDQVIATRYANTSVGYSIGFKFSINPNDGDRVEVSDFFETYDGWIYQGGGYAGAEAYVRFKDVTDQDSANKKILAVIEPLSKLINDLGNNVKVVIPGLKERKEAKEAAAKTKRQMLAKRAETLVSFVQEEQSKRLEHFQKIAADDAASWKFECVRKGDYLAITMVRLTWGWDSGASTEKPKTTVLAVGLSDKPNIRFIPGAAPNLNGHGEFYESQTHYKGDPDWSSVLRFPDVTLPPEDGVVRVEDGWVGHSFINGRPDGGLGVIVDKIAQDGQYDKIIIGEGGGSEWDDKMAALSSGGMFTYSISTQDEMVMKKQRPGVSISIPYGLGNAVYNQIMDAIAQGSTQ